MVIKFVTLKFIYIFSFNYLLTIYGYTYNPGLLHYKQS